MKYSIAASVIILVIAALFGIKNHQRLVAAGESQAKLITAAAQLGISLDPSQPDDPILITKRERENKKTKAKLVAAELISLFRKMQAVEENGGSNDENFDKLRSLNERISQLNLSQLKIIISEFRAAKDFNDKTRERSLRTAIFAISEKNAADALTITTELHGLFEEKTNADLISHTLILLANDDPLDAQRWINKNNEKFGKFIDEDTKRSLISITARRSPESAFKLAEQLELQEPNSAILSIIGAAKIPQQLTATLSAFRQHLANLPAGEAKDLAEQKIGRFARSIDNQGFTLGTKWIDESNFTPAELETLSYGISNLRNSTESSKWIEWIGEKLPPEKARDRVNNFVRNWTRNDYQAVDKWLNTAADGPTKNTAIQSYAETISKVEPAAAARWAMTLPPGEDRNRTLTTIYQNWPDDDPAAKEAFKQEHGIK